MLVFQPVVHTGRLSDLEVGSGFTSAWGGSISWACGRHARRLGTAARMNVGKAAAATGRELRRSLEWRACGDHWVELCDVSVA